MVIQTLMQCRDDLHLAVMTIILMPFVKELSRPSCGCVLASLVQEYNHSHQEVPDLQHSCRQPDSGGYQGTPR